MDNTERNLLQIYRKLQTDKLTLSQAKAEAEAEIKAGNNRRTSKKPLLRVIHILAEPYRVAYPVIYGDAEEEEFRKGWNAQENITSPVQEDIANGFLRRDTGTIRYFAGSMDKYLDGIKEEDRITFNYREAGLNSVTEAQKRIAERMEQELKNSSEIATALKNLSQSIEYRLGRGELTEKKAKEERDFITFLKDRIQGRSSSNKLIIWRMYKGDAEKPYHTLLKQLKEASAPERYINAIRIAVQEEEELQERLGDRVRRVGEEREPKSVKYYMQYNSNTGSYTQHKNEFRRY